MPLNEWRGDAVPIAQVTTITVADVEVGDTFGLLINTKSIEFTATTTSAADVCAGLVELIDESTIPEFIELSAADNADGSFTLTANTAGYPFIVSTYTVNSSTGARMEVETATSGVDSVNEVQKIQLDAAYASGNFTLSIDLGSGVETTGNIAYNASASTVQAAIVGLASVASGDVNVTGAAGGPWFVEWKGTYAESEVAEFTVNNVSLSGTNDVNVTQGNQGYGGSDTIYALMNHEAAGQSGTYKLTFDGETTANINHNATPAQVKSALEALSNIAVGDVEVYGYVSALTANPGHALMIKFTGNYTGINKTLSMNALGLSKQAAFWRLLDGGLAEWPEIQLFDLGGTSTPPTGSTNTWRYSNEETDTTKIGYGRITTTSSTTGQIMYEAPALVGGTVSGGTFYRQQFDVTGGYDGQYYLVEQLQLFYLYNSVSNFGEVGSGEYTKEWEDLETEGLGTELPAIYMATAGNGFFAVWQHPDVNGQAMSLGEISSAGVSMSLARSASVTRVTAGGSGSQNETQSIVVEGSGGTFTLTYDSETTGNIAYGAVAATVQTALEGLTAIGSGNVSVSGAGTSASPYVVEFTGTLAGQNVELITGDGALLTGGSGTVTEATSHVVGVNEIQVVTLDPSVVGGTFQLQFGGASTTPIAYDASSAAVKSALDALSTISSVSVSGSAGGPWTVTFDTAPLAKKNVALLGFDDSDLEGGAGTQTMTVVRTTRSMGPNHLDDPDNWTLNRVPEWGDDVIFEQGDVSALYGGDWVATIEAVDVLTDTADLTVSEHSFVEDQKVRLFTTGTLPAGLSTGTDYYILVQDKDTVQLSATRGGDPVEITDAGSGTHTVAVHLNAFETNQRYTGQIGLSKDNANDYREYRPKYVNFGLVSTGDKQVRIGIGEGSGQPRIKLDLSNTQANVRVLSTGGSIESGVPTLLLLNSHASTNIEVIDGDVGVAFHTSEISTFNRLSIRGGNVKLGAVTYSELDKTGGELQCDEATLSGVMNING